MLVGIFMPIVIYFLPVNVAGKNVLISMLAILIMYVSINGKLLEKCVKLMLLFLVFIYLDDIFTFPCERFFNFFDNDNVRNFNYLKIKSCVYISLLILSMIKDKKSKYSKIHIDLIVYLILGSIVISMMFCLALLNQLVDYLPNNKYIIFCNVVNITNHISIFLLVVIVLYIKNTHERMEQLLKTEQLLKESQVSYYKRALKKEGDTRKYRHDMMIHLMYIQDILGMNRINDAKKYLSSILGGFKKIQNTYYVVGNEMVDTIMNYFLGMLPKNVVIDIQGRCPAEINIDDTDICTIFSNIFQNAIDEILNNDIKNAKIIVAVNRGEQYVEYNVQNTMFEKIDERYIDKNGFPKSRKMDKNNHGIGMINVHNAIERNNGSFKWYQEEEFFCVNVILPIK